MCECTLCFIWNYVADSKYKCFAGRCRVGLFQGAGLPLADCSWLDPVPPAPPHLPTTICTQHTHMAASAWQVLPQGVSLGSGSNGLTDLRVGREQQPSVSWGKGTSPSISHRSPRIYWRGRTLEKTKTNTGVPKDKGRSPTMNVMLLPKRTWDSGNPVWWFSVRKQLNTTMPLSHSTSSEGQRIKYAGKKHCIR